MVRCANPGSYGSGYPWQSPGAVVIDAAPVVLQEWAGCGSGLPGIFIAGFGGLQVSVDELLRRYCQSLGQTIDLVLTERGFHLAAAVGACGAVDSGPHTPGCLKDALVEFV